jgi:uncharacterized protein (DUF302 family)
MDTELAKIIIVSGTVQEVVEKVRSALQKEKFGIISFVNVSEKIQERTGNVLPPYIILGACNPLLSFQAIQSDERIGLLLPCNVVVTQLSANQCKVIFSNPIPLLDVAPFREKEGVQKVAKQAAEGLQAVAAELEGNPDY